jgi:hypothetical protein
MFDNYKKLQLGPQTYFSTVDVFNGFFAKEEKNVIAFGNGIHKIWS